MDEKGYDVTEGIEFIIDGISKLGEFKKFNKYRQQYENPLVTAETRTEYLNNVLETVNCAYEKVLSDKKEDNQPNVYDEILDYIEDYIKMVDVLDNSVKQKFIDNYNKIGYKADFLSDEALINRVIENYNCAFEESIKDQKDGFNYYCPT